MNEFESKLRDRMYFLVEEVKKIVDIGTSLSEGAIPNEMEAEAHISAYNLAIEARGLFRLYNDLFHCEGSIKKHEEILSKIIEEHRKDIVGLLITHHAIY